MNNQILQEANFTSFLGKASPAKTGFLPVNCYRYKIKRQIIAIWPADNYTQTLRNNLNAWCKTFLS